MTSIQNIQGPSPIDQPIPEAPAFKGGSQISFQGEIPEEDRKKSSKAALAYGTAALLVGATVLGAKGHLGEGVQKFFGKLPEDAAKVIEEAKAKAEKELAEVKEKLTKAEASGDTTAVTQLNEKIARLEAEAAERAKVTPAPATQVGVATGKSLREEADALMANKDKKFAVHDDGKKITILEKTENTYSKLENATIEYADGVPVGVKHTLGSTEKTFFQDGKIAIKETKAGKTTITETLNDGQKSVTEITTDKNKVVTTKTDEFDKDGKIIRNITSVENPNLNSVVKKTTQGLKETVVTTIKDKDKTTVRTVVTKKAKQANQNPNTLEDKKVVTYTNGKKQEITDNKNGGHTVTKIGEDVTEIALPKHGTIAVKKSGVFEYTPNNGSPIYFRRDGNKLIQYDGAKTAKSKTASGRESILEKLSHPNGSPNYQKTDAQSQISTMSGDEQKILDAIFAVDKV